MQEAQAQLAQHQQRLSQISLEADAKALVAWARWMGKESVDSLADCDPSSGGMLQGEVIAMSGWGKWMGPDTLQHLT